MALISLANAIENLRAELEGALRQGKDRDIQFNIDSVDLEMEVVAEDETSGGAKVNWWIFGGGLDTKIKDASKHKLKLSMQPVNKHGEPLRIARERQGRPD